METEMIVRLVILLVGIFMLYEMCKQIAMGFYRSFLIFKLKLKNNKIYKEKYKKHEAMLKKGEVHEWATLPIPELGEVKVCTKTGYIPSVVGFYDVEAIKSIQEQEKIEEEYKEKWLSFRDEALQEISREYGLSVDRIKELDKKLTDIQMDFRQRVKPELVKKMMTAMGVKLTDETENS